MESNRVKKKSFQIEIGRDTLDMIGKISMDYDIR